MSNIQLYEFYVKMSDSIFGHAEAESWNIPLIEIPLLLDPLTKFLGDQQKTEHELAARKIYFTHLKHFEKELFNGTKV